MSLDPSVSLPLILLGLALFVLGLWMLVRISRKAKVVDDQSAPALRRDVLDEGAERAQRNQALIDAAPAATTPAQAPVSAAANAQAVAAAPLGTDAEAGPQVVPTTAAPPKAPASAPAPAADDLSRIKGVGPKLVALLGELSVTSYAQIAVWQAADIERVDGQLGRFKGRITRDQWVEQAQLLAAHDEAGFIEKFGRNG
ncbi:hypothetical protein [Erythrobacter sanguineus]|uniref:Predicted 5' DNA nuclease, flap endonuclease-1-like, helix-3-turn-helix (H3TH) domain n=1 Tax=Erythrobacter sanguineus TaxID=198312 RepID=A0A1M7S3T7_9SPHN|nr:hypothetical protein [Erythrobacter sanguineus]SHN53081.1 Predicted 5' DNA nuclease, flap endonuclease-1-like, helix-3-turn-helix (H3TH) domain [Erythrobacter sanguineus]